MIFPKNAKVFMVLVLGATIMLLIWISGEISKGVRESWENAVENNIGQGQGAGNKAKGGGENDEKQSQKRRELLRILKSDPEKFFADWHNLINITKANQGREEANEVAAVLFFAIVKGYGPQVIYQKYQLNYKYLSALSSSCGMEFAEPKYSVQIIDPLATSNFSKGINSILFAGTSEQRKKILIMLQRARITERAKEMLLRAIDEEHDLNVLKGLQGVVNSAEFNKFTYFPMFEKMLNSKNKGDRKSAILGIAGIYARIDMNF